MPVRWTIMLAAALELSTIGSALPQSEAKPTLDYDFYKARVDCHSDNNSAFQLEHLAPGAKSYTDEQSRKNFETVSKLVNPGEPMVSRLLMHPLAPEGGGDVFHSGGRQFTSMKDPDWKAIAAFVNGATLGGRSKKN